MKHNRLIALLCLAALLISASACTFNVPSVTGVRGSGVVKTETRAVSNFHAVALTGIGDLQITQGEQESLEIEAEDNLLALIETKVENGVLYIGFKAGTGNVQPTKSIRYTLQVKELDSLSTSGVGSIEAGALKTNDLDVEITGVGSVKIDTLEATSLTVLISGTGSGEINGGKADKLKLDISGAGSYRAPDMQIGAADMSVSGVGSARLWVTEMLDVTLSGTGGVEYYGQPSLTKLVTGLGSVKSLGDHP